jgi:cytochrome c biogenesis protein
MSAIEEIATSPSIDIRSQGITRESLLSRFLGLMSSVRLGVFLLVLLGLACLIGMLVMQQNVDGFANYYHALTPAQRLVYGRLKFFDIYHAWYFDALLALLSTNIILASIDRFPKTWRFVSKPNLTVPIRWMEEQPGAASIVLDKDRESIAALVSREFEKAGWRKPVVTEKLGRMYVFAQKGVWNRLGAYAVHIALLTIFLGGFLTAQLGVTGQLPLAAGKSSDRIVETVVDLDRVNEVTMQLPFEVTFTDIEQRLIKKDGPITASNTIDWITRFTIKDESGVHEGTAQMNRPFDYRGYRFFQASFVPIGRARNITVRATAEAGTTEDVIIPRGGSAFLQDGTKIDFAEFRGNFRIGPEDPNEDTSGYPNPGAVLRVTPKDGVSQTAYAFGQQMAGVPVAKKPIAGHTYQLADFEKVSDKHILSVQRDPGANVVYVGFLMLFVTLVGVFFFSHQRVWAAVEEKSPGKSHVYLAVNTNRNQHAFVEKFSAFVEELKTTPKRGEIK